MKKKLLILLVLMKIVSGAAAQDSDIPSEILTYIETAGVTEDGLPGGKEADAEAFIEYFGNDWKTVVALLGDGLDGREQALIFSAAEFLDPDIYLAVAIEALGLFEDRKVSQGPLENLISGQTRKDGFFYANSEDARVRQMLLRAREALPEGSRVVSEIENALAGDISEEISRQRAINGLSALESLDPDQPPEKTPDRQNTNGEASGANTETQDGSSGSSIKTTERSGKSESMSVKPIFVIAVSAVLGILIFLLRAFLRGRVL